MGKSYFDEKGKEITVEGNAADAKRDAGETLEQARARHAEMQLQALCRGETEECMYLVRGAVLRCSCGSHKRKLNLPESHGIYIGENPMVNELDCEVGDNASITAFGVCNAEGNPNQKSFGRQLLDTAIGITIPLSSEIIFFRDESKKILLVGEDGKSVKGYPCTPCIISTWQNVYGENLVASHGEGSHYSRDGHSHGGGGRRLIGSPALTEQSFLVCAYGGLIEPVTSGQENTDTEWLKDKGDGEQRTKDTWEAEASHGGGSHRHDDPTHD